MKVAYNWLKDFVDIRVPPKALAEKLTMAGLEVTALEGRDGDFVFEIEITSNRPDWLSAIGIAREVAAITGKKFKPPCFTRNVSCVKNAQRTAYSAQQITIQIEDKKDCPLYTAKIIEGVKVGPSPDWLSKRLELVGCRSVNNIVDITNYIMLEYGEPLHAFDLDKLLGKTIMARRAKSGETILNIDLQQRTLNKDILVIADEKRPIAIAGIMGGRDTEVSRETKNILLEAAIFNPILIRRGRQQLGLQSESSYRFERGIDWVSAEKASWRAAELIQKLCSGRCVAAKSSGAVKPKEKKVILQLTSVDKTLGVSIGRPKLKNILSKLGFRVRPYKNAFRVDVPMYRQDVNAQIDLIEEIARIWGYAQIPTTLPKINPVLSASPARNKVSLIKDTLTALGSNEVMTYSLIDKELLEDFRPDYPAVEIANPLSKEQGVLRPLIIPSLLECVAGNVNQKQDYINVFEIARKFLAKDPPREELVLGVALCGARSLLLQQGMVKDEASNLHLKGMLGVLFEKLGIRDYDFITRGESSSVGIYVQGQELGAMFKVKRSTLEKLGIKNKDVFAAELSLEKILSYAQAGQRFVALHKYPGITRDISFIIKEEVKTGDILKAALEKGIPLLREAKIIDFYRGKHIPAGLKGLTLSCLYRSDERTLTEEEINPIHSLICAALTERFSATIR